MVNPGSKKRELKSTKMWWVPDKNEIIDCPQGLQYLINLDQLLIEQKNNIESGSLVFFK